MRVLPQDKRTLALLPAEMITEASVDPDFGAVAPTGHTSQPPAAAL